MTYSRVLQMIRRLLVAGLVVVFSASILNAEEVRGKFSLPCDTDWSGVLLPAGEYRFIIDSTGQTPMVLRSATGGRGIYRVIAYTEKLDTSAKSQLLLVREGQKTMVHILYLADVGTVFHFNVPQGYEVTSRIIASGRTKIEHIPVVTSGN